MAKIKWDQLGERLYETGVSKGVLFPYKDGKYGTGVAWNGLTAVNENPSGGEPTPLYADNIKYLNLMSTEQFGATIEAYTYPPEFEECDGAVKVGKGVTVGQQRRIPFGLCYRTEIGNDTEGSKHGYTIHLVYGLQASPSGKEYGTINEDPEAITFSWETTATPVDVPWEGCDPTAHIKINSTDCVKSELEALEKMLYGTEEAEPKLPMPEDLVEIFTTSVGE